MCNTCTLSEVKTCYFVNDNCCFTYRRCEMRGDGGCWRIKTKIMGLEYGHMHPCLDDFVTLSADYYYCYWESTKKRIPVPTNDMTTRLHRANSATETSDMAHSWDE